MTETLDELLATMVELEASDLYLTAECKPTCAVQGKMQAIREEFLTPEDTALLAKEAMSEPQHELFQRNLELNFSYKMGGTRFRMNAYYQRNQVAMVIRLIRQNILSFDKLGLPPVLKELVMSERGIILITGATGSGKSTTMATMIDYRNEHASDHIVTIEDPIEFTHEHKNCIISQREVGIDTLSFQEALKSALRQAPKVILIGEIRDMETAQFALHASDTGHLILGTLHTNSANQTLERVINMFPQEYERQLLLQLSLNLRAIICQRLVPTISGTRTAAVEVLINTPHVQELIRQDNVEELKNVMNKGANEGMQTFDCALHELVKNKTIDESVALHYADSPNDLKLRIRGFSGSGFA